MGEECMPNGEWPSLDFDLDMGSDFDLDDLENLEDFLDADFERGVRRLQEGRRVRGVESLGRRAFGILTRIKATI